jgi:hypothetical protein
MDFYTKVCLEIKGKPETLQKLEDLHKSCTNAQRIATTEPGGLVRAAFPGWHGEDDSINPESVTVKIVEDVQPYMIIEDNDGYANIDYVARLLQGWLMMTDSSSVITFEYSHDASRSVPGCYGGGAVAVSRDAIQMVDTSELLDLMKEGRYLSLDQGDVVEAKEHLGMVGPGIIWSLDWNGWSAYIDHPDACMPLYQTGAREIFSDDEQANAAKAYEDWLAKTTLEYWDCECEQGYIHPKTETKCAACGALQEDQPDSIIRDVLRAGLKFKNLEMGDGITTPAVAHRIDEPYGHLEADYEDRISGFLEE